MTTAPELSTAEAAKVAEFDAAPEPPEIVVVKAMLDLADRLQDESTYLDSFTARVGVAERIRDGVSEALR